MEYIIANNNSTKASGTMVFDKETDIILTKEPKIIISVLLKIILRMEKEG